MLNHEVKNATFKTDCRTLSLCFAVMLKSPIVFWNGVWVNVTTKWTSSWACEYAHRVKSRWRIRRKKNKQLVRCYLYFVAIIFKQWQVSAHFRFATVFTTPPISSVSWLLDLPSHDAFARSPFRFKLYFWPDNYVLFNYYGKEPIFLDWPP